MSCLPACCRPTPIDTKTPYSTPQTSPTTMHRAYTPPQFSLDAKVTAASRPTTAPAPAKSPRIYKPTHSHRKLASTEEGTFRDMLNGNFRAATDEELGTVPKPVYKTVTISKKTAVISANPTDK